MKNYSFKPGEKWFDSSGKIINAHGGGMLFHQGIYYWFGEHKRLNGKALDGVHCYSSKDLYNWKDEGLVLKVTEDLSPIERGGVLERPKVIFNKSTGKFVMWFHLELKGTGYKSALSGLAISDKVTGPYKFIDCFRPNGSMARDMTLFVDDDGTAYHFYASENNQTMHVSLLADDYLSPSGTFKRIFEGRAMEAPAICKKDGKYYLIASGCTGWDPNAARSAVANSPLGPWTELGNPCRGKDADLTFNSQSTYIQEINGDFIFMADRWNRENLKDSRYIWLPLQFEDGRPVLEYMEAWDLSFFENIPEKALAACY